MDSTKAQRDYARSLCEQLGYDPDIYDFESMTKSELSELIAEFCEELGDE